MGTGPNDDSELLLAFIRRELPQLSPQEQQIVTLRFGLDDGTVRGLDEVDRLLHVGREQIRQVEAKLSRKWRLAR